MSARIATACRAALRLRRQFDIDGVTVWAGVMTFFAAASGVVLAAHAAV